MRIVNVYIDLGVGDSGRIIYSCDETGFDLATHFPKNLRIAVARWDESLCLWCFVSGAMNRCTSKCMWRINTSKLGSFALISPWLCTDVWWLCSSSQNSFSSFSSFLYLCAELLVCVCHQRQLTECVVWQQHSLIRRRHNNKPMLLCITPGLVIFALLCWCWDEVVSMLPNSIVGRFLRLFDTFAG